MPYRVAALIGVSIVLFAAALIGCGDDNDTASPVVPRDNPPAEAVAGADRRPQALTSLEPARYLTGHTDGTHGVDFSPDGSRIATASHDRTSRIWDASSGREIHRLEGHEAAVYGVAFSADGRRVATGGMDGAVLVWNVDSGDLLAMFEGFREGATRVAFAPDGTVLAAGQLGSIRQLDVDSEEALWVTHRDVVGIPALAVSRSGRLLALGGEDGTIAVWDLNIRRPVWEAKVPLKAADLATLRQRQRPKEAGGDAEAVDPDAFADYSDLEQSGRPIGVRTVTFSGDESKVYSQTFRGPVHEWDAETGQHLRHLGLKSLAEHIAVTRDGRWLVADVRGGFQLIDLQTEAKLAALLPNDAFHEVAFSPDGTRVTAARGGHWVGAGGWQRPDDPRVPVWDVHTVTAAGGQPVAPATKTTTPPGEHP